VIDPPLVAPVSDDTLSAVLSEFARTMITDFPIQAILDHLVTRIVDVLPITSAGVTLISEGLAPRYIAASDDAALRYERLQSEIREGPCLTASRTATVVSVPDLANDDRFPLFSPAAVEAGLAAVFTFPVRHGAESLGALDLYRDTPGALDERDLATAQTLADVVASYLINAQAREVARRTSEGFHHDALHDPLTGLANRTLLLECIAQASHRAARSDSFTTVLFVDIDRFKDVNDTYGHHVGDELLVEVARRLSSLLRRGDDTLARLSGDEFVLLGENLAGPKDCETVAARVRSAFDLPFHVGENFLNVSASVGVACTGPHGVGTPLLVSADLAMYNVKRSRHEPNRNTLRPKRSVADPAAVSGMVTDSPHEHDSIDQFMNRDDGNLLASELRVSLAAGELELAYQPIIRTADQRTVGVEALLRWNHRTRGAVLPTVIVAIAEQTDLIDDVGAWVLQRACEDHRRWVGARPGLQMDICVNFSARQISDPSIVATVSRLIDNAGMDPARMVLELTETFAMDDTDHNIATLAALRGLGLRLSLDDFGSGYSSLRFLDRLPLDVLKIDRHFISRLDASDSGTALIRGITRIAHELGLSVTAEGVETAVQHRHVVDSGCDSAQGFLYARPMTAATLDTFLDHPLHGRTHAAL
jgi:diguanylate cyclase (GGDEF)-like protein